MNIAPAYRTRTTVQDVLRHRRVFVPAIEELTGPAHLQLRKLAAEAYGSLHPRSVEHWQAAVERTAASVLRRLERVPACSLVRAVGVDSRPFLPVALALLVWGTEQVNVTREVRHDGPIRVRRNAGMSYSLRTPSPRAGLLPFEHSELRPSIDPLPVSPMDLWASQATADVLVTARGVLAYLRRAELEGAPYRTQAAVRGAVGRSEHFPGAWALLWRMGALAGDSRRVRLSRTAAFPVELGRRGSQAIRRAAALEKSRR